MPAIPDAIATVKRRWQENGAASTFWSIVETLVSPLVRRRRRLVYVAQLSRAYHPSAWEPGEQLLVIGPDNIDSLDPELLASLDINKHREDFNTLRKGNRLFVAASHNTYLHRGYVCTIDPPAVANHERKAIFFGTLRGLPTIRSCETSVAARGKGLYRRVLNEELHYLRGLGYTGAVLYIMGGNIASIKGVEAAGFELTRVLTDVIFLNWLVFQKVGENNSDKWRVFCQ